MDRQISWYTKLISSTYTFKGSIRMKVYHVVKFESLDPRISMNCYI